MVIYSDIIGTSPSILTTFFPIVGSPYSPLVSGNLIQVKLYFSQTTAASVLSAATVKLTCPLWGVPVYATIQGGGLMTAPAPTPIPGIQNCLLPVKTGVQITAEVRHEAGIVAVTPQLIIQGVFEA